MHAWSAPLHTEFLGPAIPVGQRVWALVQGERRRLATAQPKQKHQKSKEHMETLRAQPQLPPSSALWSWSHDLQETSLVKMELDGAAVGLFRFPSWGASGAYSANGGSGIASDASGGSELLVVYQDGRMQVLVPSQESAGLVHERSVKSVPLSATQRYVRCFLKADEESTPHHTTPHHTTPCLSFGSRRRKDDHVVPDVYRPDHTSVTP